MTSSSDQQDSAAPPQATAAETTPPTTTMINEASPKDSGDHDSKPDEVRKTPFTDLASSVTIPEPAPLTTDQETAYNSLLNAVSEWCVLTTTEDGASKSVPLVDEEYMWLTRDCLLRYLRASKWDVATASQRLVDTLQWRRSYGITCVPPDTKPMITADLVSVENETGKQWILGYDNAGRPCLYLNPARQNTPRSERQIQHLFFMLERVIDLMPAGQETVAMLMNFAETSKGQNASISQGRQCLNILQTHYPERLGKALLCNLPWHMWAFMKIIMPFVDPVTRAKLIFDAPLAQHVPAEQLTTTHGGALAFEYEHAVYWPALLALAEERRAAMVERWERGGKLVGEYERYMKGGTDRSLRDDRRDDPNERGRGQPLNASASSRGNSVRSASGKKLPGTRERSVVVVTKDDAAADHPLKRSTTSDSFRASHEGSGVVPGTPTKTSPNGKVGGGAPSSPERLSKGTPTKVTNGELVSSPTTATPVAAARPTTVEE